MDTSIYQDIATRTGGNIYIGVVGPVRTGKSTFIKRFMDTLVIPNIEDVYMRERAKDELPQSGSGRTIMTAEPKFVPEDAVTVTLDGGERFSVRLIDSVGYIVPGAAGQYEDGEERMVTTPWFDHEVTLSEAAELGTQKVITDHSTIGIVVTTDGTVTELGREAYVDAEARVIRELRAIGKPFLILINSAQPDGAEAQQLRDDLSSQYGVTCIVTDCLRMDAESVSNVIKSVLYEFPVTDVGIYLPSWAETLPDGHEIKQQLYASLADGAAALERVRDIDAMVSAVSASGSIGSLKVRSIDLGSGEAFADYELPRSLFYETVSNSTGITIKDDGDIMSALSELSVISAKYEKLRPALEDVSEKGYGIVLPDSLELRLDEPEIVRQNGRYGVRLKASAPSIHMIRATVETEVSPAVGSSSSSDDMINFLLQEFDGDKTKIWESNLFGKSLYDIAGEGLQSKVKKLTDDTQNKLRETLQRIVNEGSGGLICIIL